jgi:hypothetical protein
LRVMVGFHRPNPQGFSVAPKFVHADPVCTS